MICFKPHVFLRSLRRPNWSWVNENWKHGEVRNEMIRWLFSWWSCCRLWAFMDLLVEMSVLWRVQSRLTHAWLQMMNTFRRCCSSSDFSFGTSIASLYWHLYTQILDLFWSGFQISKMSGTFLYYQISAKLPAKPLGSVMGMTSTIHLLGLYIWEDLCRQLCTGWIRYCNSESGPIQSYWRFFFNRIQN